jgi:hypothetical protein
MVSAAFFPDLCPRQPWPPGRTGSRLSIAWKRALRRRSPWSYGLPSVTLASGHWRTLSHRSGCPVSATSDAPLSAPCGRTCCSPDGALIGREVLRHAQRVTRGAADAVRFARGSFPRSGRHPVARRTLMRASSRPRRAGESRCAVGDTALRGGAQAPVRGPGSPTVAPRSALVPRGPISIGGR